MGVYRRRDSKFWWLWLERPNQPAIRESSEIPLAGGSPEQDKELKRQAQEQYAARMVELARRRHRLPATTEARTFALHREWYSEHVSTHKRGVTRERSMLKQLAAFFDDCELADIDVELAREWRTQRLTEVSASTVRREETILKHLLSTATPKYLDHNPLARLPQLRVAGTDTRVLTTDEETRLLHALGNREARALVICALDTLLRLSNVRALTRKQDHTTHLFSDTKTEAIRIPISTRLRKALNDLPMRGAFYFPSYAGGGNSHTIAMFIEACRRAKLPLGRKTGGISFHCLRHTGATRMLAAGVDIKTVMRIGGWKNLKVMERYLHPTDEAARVAVNAVGKHVSLTRPGRIRTFPKKSR